MIRLSIVVPTRNEERNIATCLDAFADFREQVELIVVDNYSPDRTREIASEKGARVFVQGPERCAQRNRGWREAVANFVMFVDADMVVPKATIEELLSCLSSESPADAFYIPEHRIGDGLRISARNFERSFYDATCIDGLRVISRSSLEKVGGYDEELVACEDWDLDRRLIAVGIRIAKTNGCLYHNEARQNLRSFLRKKAYYSTSVSAYRAKWGNDAICRRQFGVLYRYLLVFVENGKWKRLFRHPILASVMYLERFAVGIVYLINR